MRDNSDCWSTSCMLDRDVVLTSAVGCLNKGLAVAMRGSQGWIRNELAWCRRTKTAAGALLACLIGSPEATWSAPSMQESLPPIRHPLAVQHTPFFVTSPGSTDILLVVMAALLVGAVLAVGVLFFWLHSLPERLVHNSTKVHFDIVAVLALISLFTHIHLFWVAALLLALVRFPDFSIPGLNRIATSLEKMADGRVESTNRNEVRNQSPGGKV